MPSFEEDLRSKAQGVLPRAIELRRSLHEHPELGNHLPDTRRRVVEALADLDLEIAYSDKTSSFVATLRSDREGPCLLLRADMDALPVSEDSGVPFASKNSGLMHACGHDAHTSMLVGAAHVLSQEGAIPRGEIKFFFQSGEEGHFGARICLEEGLLDRGRSPDAAFAMHVDAKLPAGRIAGRAGPLLASADVWSITVKGRGGHASMPHQTLDPIPAACEIVGALQSMVTRRISAFDPAVITTTMIKSGTTNNVIPETATLTGTIRATSDRARKAASEGLHRVAQGVALAHGLEVEVVLHEGYPVTRNDDGFTEFVRGVAGEVLGGSAYIDMPSPAMGAEDFSYVLERTPGAMLFLGMREDGASHPAPVHSGRMRLNEEAMANGIAMHTAVALRYLS